MDPDFLYWGVKIKRIVAYEVYEAKLFIMISQNIFSTLNTAQLLEIALWMDVMKPEDL